MDSVFDILATTLFIATAGLYVVRVRHEHPPLAPYLVIVLVCAAGSWLGNHGGGVAAVALLMAASFLTLHLASQPYREEPEERS